MCVNKKNADKKPKEKKKTKLYNQLNAKKCVIFILDSRPEPYEADADLQRNTQRTVCVSV